MYDNIGGKIKALAKFIFIFQAIAMFITGIVLLAVDDDLIAVGLPLALVGPLLAWISSWLLYGFGELIEKTCQIERNTRGDGKATAAPQVARAVSERIVKLEKLRAQGLITEEEYLQALSREQ